MSFLVSVFKPLAYISLPVILLRSIAANSPIGRYYVRVGVYVGTLTAVAACSAVVAAGMSAIGRRFDVNYVVARTFYALTKGALGVEIEVEGQEFLDTRPAVLMANHQSMLDVLVVGRLMPKQTSIMAKKSLQYTPLGPFMTMSGAIFVDRGNNTRAVQSLGTAGQLMKRLGISLWMFPEGTRTSSEEPEMLPLKKGGFHLAIQSGIPIIPIVTENYWRLYRTGVFDEGSFKVRVLPPIPTAGLSASDVPALAVRVRDQMLETLREISVVPSGKREKPSEEQDRPQSTPVNAPLSMNAPLPTNDKKIPSKSTDLYMEPSTGSSVSIASSFSSASLSKSVSSENGAETEEDEGMILVGRPT